jgi:mono/diheme cytochrome c family protein
VKIILVGLVALMAACTATPTDEPVIIQGTPVPAVPTLDPTSITRGKALYTEFCASCHGANLEGEPNWQSPGSDGSFPAPPHDSSGHTWHHPDQQLRTVIIEGGNPILGATMPAFGDKLSSDEISVILDYIKSYWGFEEREFQWWITARDLSQ